MPIQTLILACKLYSSGHQIMPHIPDYLNLWPALMLEVFSSWDIKKVEFQFLVTFLAVFFPVCKLYKSDIQIIPHISDHLNFMASVDIGDF